MVLNYPPEEGVFDDEVRWWLHENPANDLRDKVVNYNELSKDDLLRWGRIVAKKGWVASAHVSYAGVPVVFGRSNRAPTRAAGIATRPTERVAVRPLPR
jgi:hypothetical protein